MSTSKYHSVKMSVVISSVFCAALYVSLVGKNTSNTFFLPQDVGNQNNLVAK